MRARRSYGRRSRPVRYRTRSPRGRRSNRGYGRSGMRRRSYYIGGDRW